MPRTPTSNRSSPGAGRCCWTPASRSSREETPLRGCPRSGRRSPRSTRRSDPSGPDPLLLNSDISVRFCLPSCHRRRGPPMLHATRRLLLPLLAAVACLLLVGTARAETTPVEPYASYQPQTACAPKAKPGTVALGHWLVRTYGGGFGRISETCRGRSVSEHKEGRAFDWSLNALKTGDRTRAQRFLRAAFATGPSGEPAELARRMGIMYVIWNDHIYASYD